MASRRGIVLRCAIVRRVSVVGVSGAGKSTVARELSVILGVPRLELDGVFHQPGWEPLPDEEFRRAVAAEAAADGWVIDGNYSTVRPLVWARADTVVWLDLPKVTVMRQVVWRTLRRVAGLAGAVERQPRALAELLQLGSAAVHHLLDVAQACRVPGEVRRGGGRSGQRPPAVRPAGEPPRGQRVPGRGPRGGGARRRAGGGGRADGGGRAGGGGRLGARPRRVPRVPL